MARVVLDSTVLVNAFLNRTGAAGALLDLAGTAFALCLAPEIIAETRRKLLTGKKIRRYASYPDEEVEAYARTLSELAEEVRDLPPLQGVVRDPNDDVIVACALKAQAQFIVAWDKDLRDLGQHQGIRIVAPDAFLGMLRRGAV